MYRDKLASLKDQLIQLETGLHPEYLRKIRRLEQIYEDRIVLNESFLAFEVSFLIIILFFTLIIIHFSKFFFFKRLIA
jgi:hypothetical protein